MSKKSTDRLAFNFLKSYYEVFKKLTDDKSKAEFVQAICERQFNGIETDLEGMADFAYVSQKHSIDASREGWENLQKRTKVVTPSTPPSTPPSEGPSTQEEEEEEVKEKEEIKSVFTFDEFWKMYPNKTAKKAAEKKYKNVTEENRQIIKDTLNNFINNKPFESYTIPNPATYIFNERWTDEITIKDKVHSSGVILGLDVLYQAASVTGGMQRLSDKYGYTLEELKEMYNAALIKGGHKPVNND